MSNKVKLKPCPFCGGKVRLFHKEHFTMMKRRFDYNCLRCDAYISLMARSKYKSAEATEAEAIITWNRRADNDSKVIT